jgi:hypothetical protein
MLRVLYVCVCSFFMIVSNSDPIAYSGLLIVINELQRIEGCHRRGIKDNIPAYTWRN